MNLTLTQTVRESHDVSSFIFRPDCDLQWRAGQFLRLWLPHSPADDRQIDRYFTIASAPHERLVRITTRFASHNGSSFKRALRELPIGASVEAGELDGDFVVDGPARRHVFIAGGIGITPFHAMLLDLEHRLLPLNVTLLYGNRDSDFVYESEFEALAEDHPEFEIHYVVSPLRLDVQTIRHYVPAVRDSMFFVSGPEHMVETLGTMLKDDLGIAESQLKQDWFPNYESGTDLQAELASASKTQAAAPPASAAA